MKGDRGRDQERLTCQPLFKVAWLSLASWMFNMYCFSPVRSHGLSYLAPSDATPHSGQGLFLQPQPPDPFSTPASNGLHHKLFRLRSPCLGSPSLWAESLVKQCQANILLGDSIVEAPWRGMLEIPNANPTPPNKRPLTVTWDESDPRLSDTCLCPSLQI